LPQLQRRDPVGPGGPDDPGGDGGNPGVGPLEKWPIKATLAIMCL
jgi:hypothetical protein